uniref:Uncharacterized protein n=1 Tax=Florenciella parvula TaxID=236787 RepID=A0A7S2CRZ1_9STRA|mmetsp:Transcript_3884/g.8077  ORF Transcript_3884/g.8077 Transcript_3884/m.8077 type:complete len:146 (+) Transcript_3884:2-439(+)
MDDTLSRVDFQLTKGDGPDSGEKALAKVAALEDQIGDMQNTMVQMMTMLTKMHGEGMSRPVPPDSPNGAPESPTRARYASNSSPSGRALRNPAGSKSSNKPTRAASRGHSLLPPASTQSAEVRQREGGRSSEDGYGSATDSEVGL